MSKGLYQQKLAVQSGAWPLYRFNPELVEEGKNPLTIDSSAPSISISDYAYNETRYKSLLISDEERAEALMKLADEDAFDRWQNLTYLAEKHSKQK
jgi:pyruvate-ferredoxin/flavodoxin oxidoreductase